LNGTFSSFKQDLIDVFSKETLKNILIVVILNIFLSYGFLYLSDVILNALPDIGSLIDFQMSSAYLNNSLVAVGSFIATVFISPVSEELIFRGVLLNRLKTIVPTLFSILISSLLFASLHTYGSIIAAFIFGICMAILYLKTDNILVPIFAHFLNNLFAESIVIADTANVLFTNGRVIGIMSLLAILSFIFIMNSVIRELNKIK
jgi:membrane protease YdiL (CAAX protease family)